MKKKTGMYLAIGIIGIALALIAKFLLQDYLSDSQSGAMIGIGAGLFGYGIAKWCVGLWGAKNELPVKKPARFPGVYTENRAKNCCHSLPHLPRAGLHQLQVFSFADAN